MPAQTIRKQIMSRVKTLVVKIGSDVLAGKSGKTQTHDRRVIRDLAQAVANLRESGVKVVLVSSGAIGRGLAQLGQLTRPKRMERLQAAAAIGQPHLMRLYETAFARHDLKVGQILLTRSDFEDRQRYVNIKHTIEALHTMRAVPVINENDTVAVDEIRFGENDILAAMVANLLRAELLVFLSSVDGLLRDGAVVDVVDQIDQHIYSLDHGSRSQGGLGGMSSKLQAAALVTDAGDAAIIANGKLPQALDIILQGRQLGTLFIPADRKINARRRWIAAAAKSTGSLTVDEGAAQAVRKSRKSLLAIGVTAVRGNFRAGQVVTVLDPVGRLIARGKVSYSAAKIRKIMGLNSTQIVEVLGPGRKAEVIHADNLAVKRN